MAIKDKRQMKSAEVRAAVQAAMQKTEVSELLIRQATRDPILEKDILGACLLDPACMEQAVELIAPEDFTVRIHMEVWYAMQRLANEGIIVDITTVGSQLSETKTLADIGGTPAIEDIARGAQPIGFDIESYAKLLKRKTTARKLVEFGVQMGTVVNSSSNMVERAESMLSRISENEPGGKEVTGTAQIIDALQGGFREFLNIERPSIVSSPWRKFNMIVDGFRRGDFVVIGGRPGTGKTIMGVQIAEYVSFATGTKQPEEMPSALIASLEMTKEALLRRMMCARLGIPSRELRAGTLNPDQEAMAKMWKDWMARCPVSIVTNAYTLRKLEYHIRRCGVNGEPARLTVVDYLQLMRGAAKFYPNKVQEMTEISNGLKRIAKDLGTTIIALSQLSRAVEQREDKQPQLSDLKESGSIEADADIVAMIFRPELYDKKTPGLRGVAEFLVEKQRDGETGRAKVKFEGQFHRFVDVADEPSEPVQ